MQMNLLELILKLQQKESQTGVIWHSARRAGMFVRREHAQKIAA